MRVDLGFLIEVIPLLAALVVGLSVHEYAHARAAYALGDTTAWEQGRMTLNPIKHIDPFGALAFLIMRFGWAKPVPIDPYRLGRQGTVVVAAAGPVSNLLLAVIGILPLRLGLVPIDASNPFSALTAIFMLSFAFYNVMLAVFNMLPIAPLDGWRVLVGVVPEDVGYSLQRYEAYGGLILMLLIMSSFIGFSVFGKVLLPIVKMIMILIAGPELTAQIGL